MVSAEDKLSVLFDKLEDVESLNKESLNIMKDVLAEARHMNNIIELHLVVQDKNIEGLGSDLEKLKIMETERDRFCVATHGRGDIEPTRKINEIVGERFLLLIWFVISSIASALGVWLLNNFVTNG